MGKLYFFLLLILFVTVLSCNKIEYSPNQKFDHNSPQHINDNNIARLLKTENPGPLRIAFIGDSQRYYDEAVDFKNKVNSMEQIDLVILAGDISDFGLKEEMEWVNEIFSQINAPYVAVIGNHDLVANGRETYKRMFGELDFSFVYKRTRFVFHNTNGREYNFNGKVPNLPWLEEQCKHEPGIDHVLAVSHVPPYDVDFDSTLTKAYHNILKNTPNLLASLHGHLHNGGDGYYYNDQVRYINSNAVDKREFMLLEIIEGQIKRTMVEY